MTEVFCSTVAPEVTTVTALPVTLTVSVAAVVVVAVVAVAGVFLLVPSALLEGVMSLILLPDTVPAGPPTVITVTVPSVWHDVDLNSFSPTLEKISTL